MAVICRASHHDTPRPRLSLMASHRAEVQEGGGGKVVVVGLLPVVKPLTHPPNQLNFPTNLDGRNETGKTGDWEKDEQHFKVF